MWRRSVGRQVALLSPETWLPTTAATFLLMSGGFSAWTVAVPTVSMGPTAYPTALAGMLIPRGPVSGVDMTEATQSAPAAAPRWSVTLTRPRLPRTVPLLAL